MPIQNRQKKSLLINPKFQWMVIGYAVLMATLILLSIWGLFIFGFHQFTEIGVQAGFAPDHVYFQFIHMQETMFNRLMMAIALVVGVFLTVGGICFSHRIAGPIYRMQKEFRSMSESEPFALHLIQFRKGDFFPELASTFNHLVEVWKKKRP